MYSMSFLSIHRTRHNRNHGVWNSKGAILLIGEIIHLSFLQVIIFHDFFYLVRPPMRRECQSLQVSQNALSAMLLAPGPEFHLFR